AVERIPTAPCRQVPTELGLRGPHGPGRAAVVGRGLGGGRGGHPAPARLRPPRGQPVLPRVQAVLERAVRRRRTGPRARALRGGARADRLAGLPPRGWTCPPGASGRLPGGLGPEAVGPATPVPLLLPRPHHRAPGPVRRVRGVAPLPPGLRDVPRRRRAPRHRVERVAGPRAGRTDNA